MKSKYPHYLLKTIYLVHVADEEVEMLSEDVRRILWRLGILPER